MIPIEEQVKKKIAMYVSETDGKGTYPSKRAALLAHALKDEAIIIFLCDQQSPVPPAGFPALSFEGTANFMQLLKKVRPDVLVRDSGSTSKDEMAKLRQLVPSILHIDDFGEGGEQADLVIQTLYAEQTESLPSHYIAGHETFLADPAFLEYKESGLLKKPSFSSPHLVIYFGDEDAGNLTYRALRHVKQLQIPLKITVLIGSNYTHDLSEIQLMALSHRNTVVKKAPDNLASVYAAADLILCGSGYMPYEVAVIGVPCVVLAQNEFESNLAFPKEQDGFIHLGLGRKVKQSNLLNAIMEPLLHDSRRERAIRRQLALDLGSGGGKLVEGIRYLLEYPQRLPSRKSELDMLH